MNKLILIILVFVTIGFAKGNHTYEIYHRLTGGVVRTIYAEERYNNIDCKTTVKIKTEKGRLNFYILYKDETTGKIVHTIEISYDLKDFGYFETVY